MTIRRPPAFAAIDLGASSGRVLRGDLQDGRLALVEVARFSNEGLRLPDGLHWNPLSLFEKAIRAVRAAGPVAGVGIDGWGVDYALLDQRGRLRGLPYHYRDARTDGMVARARARVSAQEQYAITGIQTMPINTIFQLLAEQMEGGQLSGAARLVMIPDLLAFWLSGELANEITCASTTGLLQARADQWADGLIDRLGLPLKPFGALVDPGTELGPARHELELGSPTVRTVASHDTASAFVAAPIADDRAAVLSSGTWSLLGLELAEPLLNDYAREANLTNERGVDGTTRLLKNVMGLWLEQECARTWRCGHAELFAAAASAEPAQPLFDPDQPDLLPPGDMPSRIAAACRRSGQDPPSSRGATVRSILLSLACKYRYVLECLQESTGRAIERIHVIGGGAQVELLCQLTADLTGCEVIAGPVEAAALGNVLVQARAAAELSSLAEMRCVAAASTRGVTYEPSSDRGVAEATYQRFLEVIDLPRRIAA